MRNELYDLKKVIKKNSNGLFMNADKIDIIKGTTTHSYGQKQIHDLIVGYEGVRYHVKSYYVGLHGYKQVWTFEKVEVE